MREGKLITQYLEQDKLVRRKWIDLGMLSTYQTVFNWNKTEANGKLHSIHQLKRVNNCSKTFTLCSFSTFIVVQVIFRHITPTIITIICEHHTSINFILTISMMSLCSRTLVLCTGFTWWRAGAALSTYPNFGTFNLHH